MKVKALGILRCRRKYNFDRYKYVDLLVAGDYESKSTWNTSV